MSRARLVGSCLRALARHKLRTLAMSLGSFVGVAALTFVLTIGGGAQAKLLRTMSQLFGPSTIVVTAGGGFFLGGPRGPAQRLTLDDAEALADAVPEVEAWDPMQIVPSASVRRGEANTTVRLLGLSERSERVWGRGAETGAYLDASAVAGAQRVAVIGPTVARTLFAGEDPVGAEIQIGSVPFRVTGVLEPLGTDIHGMDRDNEIVIPISTAMRRVMNVDTLRAVKLVVRDPARQDAAAAEVRRALRERHALSEGQPDDFGMMTSAGVDRTVAQVRRVLFLYLPLVAGIALVAGGTVAATLMLGSVSARTGEIGLRRAVGARPRDIRLQFLVETAATAVVGGAVGALLGCGLAWYVAARMGLSVWLAPGAVLLGLALAGAIGLGAGVVPARRAARLEPAVALR